MSLSRLDQDGAIPPARAGTGAWRLGFADGYLPADLDGDGADELLILGASRLGILRWEGEAGKLAFGANGMFGGWTIAEAGERAVAGQFLAGGGEEVVLASRDRWLTVGWNQEAWNAGASPLALLAAQSGSLLPPDPKAPGAAVVELRSDQRLFAGSFLPEAGDDAVLVRSGQDLVLAAFQAGAAGGESLAGFQPVALFAGRVGDWPLDESDDLLPLQADGDPELEVLARKGDLLGVLNLMPVNYAFLLRVDPGELMPSDPPRFRRGDVNLSRTVDISDAVRLLNFLFLGDSISCADAADANDSGRLDIADSVYILLFLFMHGQSPAPPGPFVPGIDPTIDALGCGNA